MDKPVAHGPDRFNEARIPWIISQLLPKRRDVYINRPVEHLVIPVTHIFEQLFARLDPSRGLGQAEEKVELDRGEGDRFVPDDHGPHGRMDMKVADDDFIRCIGDGDGIRGGSGPPGHGSEAGEKFSGGSGLGEIVIGAHFQPHDTIGFIAAGGEHEDGHFGGAPNLFQGLEAIQARHHDIQYDGMPWLGSCRRHAGFAVVDGLNLVPHGTQVIAEQSAEFPVVIDQEDFWKSGRSRSLGLRHASAWWGGGIRATSFTWA